MLTLFFLGDVSVKPEASCLVLTTEILRSMLYQVFSGCITTISYFHSSCFHSDSDSCRIF